MLTLLYLEGVIHIVLKQNISNNPITINLHPSLTHAPEKYLGMMQVYNLYQVENSLFFHGILHTLLFKYLFSATAKLDNYKGLINL